MTLRQLDSEAEQRSPLATGDEDQLEGQDRKDYNIFHVDELKSAI